MRVRLFGGLVFFVLLLAAAPPLQATLVKYLPFSEMVKKTDVIAHIRVGQPKTMRDGRDGLITLTPLEVIEGYKGTKQGSVLELYQVGGSVGSEQKWINGAYRFQKGEEYILFADRFGDRVVTFGIGVGRYVVDRTGEFPSVQEDFGDVIFYKGEGGFETPAPSKPRSLSAFKNELAAIQSAPLKPMPHRKRREWKGNEKKMGENR